MFVKQFINCLWTCWNLDRILCKILWRILYRTLIKLSALHLWQVTCWSETAWKGSSGRRVFRILELKLEVWLDKLILSYPRPTPYMYLSNFPSWKISDGSQKRLEEFEDFWAKRLSDSAAFRRGLKNLLAMKFCLSIRFQKMTKKWNRTN